MPLPTTSVSFYSPEFQSSSLFHDICAAIHAGDKQYLDAIHQQSLLPLSPYWLLLACSIGDVTLVSFFINKVNVPIYDDIYMAGVHSIHACNIGSLDCLLLLKIALIPLAKIDILLQHLTNHCSAMHEGHLEIFEYLLTTYGDHPAFSEHEIADYNIQRFLSLLLPENGQIILWCYYRGYDVSMYENVIEELLHLNKPEIPVVSSKAVDLILNKPFQQFLLSHSA